MHFWTLQKKIKIGSKLYYVFFLLNKNKVLCRLGYIMHFPNLIVVKINLQKLFIYLFYYNGILNIRESIYLKFFILSYFYLLEFNNWNKFKI